LVALIPRNSITREGILLDCEGVCSHDGFTIGIGKGHITGCEDGCLEGRLVGQIDGCLEGFETGELEG
jgi:hypothetical protein